MKMRKWKKYVALLLALAMVASLTVTSLAETDDSDTIEGVVVEASESADVEVTDDTEDEEVSDEDAAVEQTEDEDAEETEIETAEVSEGTEDAEVTEDVIESDSEEILSVSSQAVSVLSSEDEDDDSYAYYDISCYDEDVLAGNSYYISKYYTVYYYAEYYDDENWGYKYGYCEIESIDISGSATCELDEDGYYVINPYDTGEVTVTLYYTPASDVEDTEYNGEYTFTLNVVEEISGYFVDVSSDTDCLLPGKTATFDATVYYWTNSSEDGYEKTVYDGTVTYEWDVEDGDNVLASTSDNGASLTLTAQDSFDVDESAAFVYLDVYGEDGELLASYSCYVTVCKEYYELVLSEDSFYLTEGETVEVKPTLYLCTADGSTSVTSDVTYDIDSDSMRGSWSWSGEGEKSLDKIFYIDGLSIGVFDDLPSGFLYAEVTYDVIATIDGESVAYTSVTASVDGPTIYEYYYGYSDQECVSNTEFYISKEYSGYCLIETHEQGETDYSSENISLNKVTAVNDAGDSLAVEEDDDYFILIPDEEGTVTVTLYYDPIEGSDDENEGQYSFELYVSDTLTLYYVNVESDSSGGSIQSTLLPGQSLSLTATCMYYTYSADGSVEGEYDGDVNYYWYIDDDWSSVCDVVTISSSGDTCEVVANESLDEGYARIVVEASDDEGNLFETGYYYIYVYSEYYVYSVEEHFFSLEPGEVAEIKPSVIYYNTDNPDGVNVTDETDYSLKLIHYNIPDENLEFYMDSDLEALGAVSVDSDSLTVTAHSCSYSEVYAEVSLYVIRDDVSTFVGIITILVTSDSEEACEHENLIHYEDKDPTCTTDGNEEYWVCSDCGLMFSDSGATEIISEVPVIPATGHDYEEEVVTEDPTCTEDGKTTTTYTCTICGDSYSETESIPATGHTWGDEVIWEWADDYSSATATFTCTVCGETCDVDAVITSEQTDDGITYTAEATLDDVSAADTKSVSITSTTVTGDTQSSVDDSVDEAYQEIAENVAASVNVGDALQNVAQELGDEVDYAEVLEKLAEEDIIVDENSDVTITTETYLVTVVRALEIDEEAGTAVLTIDISMYYTVTASAGGDSVTIDDGKVTKTTWDPVEVTIDVTDIPFADVDSIYVKHNASDGTYYYKASYDESAQTITFTNLHGFSEFTVSVDSRTATVYYSDIDETDSYTPEDVSSALPTASRSGYTFNGWTFDGVEGTFTTLTDDLLTALSALGVDTVTATASFTEIVSEDTTDTDSETADSTADNTDSTTKTTDDADSATGTTDSSSATAASTSTTTTGDYNTTGLWVMLVLAGAVAVFGVIRRRSNAR